MPSLKHVLLFLFFLGAAAGAGQERGSREDQTPPSLLTLQVTINPDRLFHPQTGWFREGPNVDHNDYDRTRGELLDAR